MDKLKWWGYKHVNGSLQAKRYFEDQDWVLDDAYESPFVDQVVRPFKAEGREEALKIIQDKTK